MPILQFKGKTFVQNHHLAVPYHQLIPKPDKSMADKVSLNDNLIIHGDNLLALKSLLPTYAGKVKCIYIDPPYNTGNEGWVYNDKVNGPIIKEWIGQVVGKEGEDLVRHDKWLCMMAPRIKLLRELLRSDGVIFMSIGEEELASLKSLSDEVFGEENFISIVTRIAKTASNKGTYFAPSADFLVVYAKNKVFLPSFQGEVDTSLYKKSDEKGQFRDDVALYQSALDSRPNQRYYIECPDGSMVIPPGNVFPEEKKDAAFVKPKDNNDKVWRWSYQTYQENKNLLVFKETKTSPLLDEDENKAKYNIYTKSYLTERKKSGTQPRNFLTDFINRKSADFLKTIGVKFDHGKPVELVSYLLSICGVESGDIVLDSFAGSGTTAQAVLELNKEDGGNRKFILVEMEDYADTITAERVRRVIKGVPKAKNELVQKGLGGSFSFFELGDAIEMESLLSGEDLPGYEELARYLYYTATGDEFVPDKLDEVSHFIGSNDDYDVFVYYKPDIGYLKTTALTLDEARALREKAGSKPLLVFAPTKYVEQQTLDELKITFCQLPFEIYRMKK